MVFRMRSAPGLASRYSVDHVTIGGIRSTERLSIVAVC